MRAAWLMALLLAAISTPSQAEITREAAARLGVDIVLLKGGREARGCIVQRREGDRLTIAVRRAWLESRQQGWLAEVNAAAANENHAALDTLIARTRDWQTARVTGQQLTGLVQSELDVFERRLANNPPPAVDDEPSEFVLVSIPEDQIRRVYAQTPERRQAALVAWREHLDNVESSSVDKLHKQLEARMIDWHSATVDFSDWLPKQATDDEREWAARTAIYEYAFQQRLEFQGTGDFIVRTGDDAANPAAGDLLAGLLQGSIGGDISSLLQGALGANNGPVPPKAQTWLDTATRIAEAEDVHGFHVTRSAQDVSTTTVTVEDRFVARMPDGSWETVWLTSVALDASQERSELEDRIRKDQQVTEALKLVQNVGLGGQVDTAIRFGAATMEAQQTATARFAEFLERYNQRLDGPALKWNAD
ncbi:MAG: hypothetical protein JNG89_07800 [Planctomycetaceae bacterium]|nr:hypothetical protein [Planctomycetaceae bacterium]